MKLQRLDFIKIPLPMGQFVLGTVHEVLPDGSLRAWMDGGGGQLETIPPSVAETAVVLVRDGRRIPLA